MKETPQSVRQRGAVLLGVIILAALLLIGAATIGIIYVRQLNQQRQVQTQTYLQTAFAGLFPGNLRKAANLNSDFGYDPNVKPVPPSNHDLRMLVDRAAVGTSDSVHTAIAQFNGTTTATTATLNAWNGPYWAGPVDGQNRPVDGWGRPMQLRYISTSSPPGWQVFSVGANGASETGDSAMPSGDDQVYPVAPYKVPVVASTTCPTPAVVISRTSGFNPAEDITVTVSWTGDTPQTQGPITVNNGNGGATFTFSNLPIGTLITVQVTSSKSGNPFFRTFADKQFTLTSSCSPYTFVI